MSLTPELYELIIKVVDDRVKEIKVTREEFDKLRKSMNKRFSRMERAINNLAEAQLKTEGELENLTSKVDHLTERVEALAEAQLRTEERLGGSWLV